MNILITGDKGFVGTATRRLLEASNHQVFGYDLMDGLDIRDIDQLRQEIKKNDIQRILHLAAIARFSEADKDPILAHETQPIRWVRENQIHLRQMRQDLPAVTVVDRHVGVLVVGRR